MSPPPEQQRLILVSNRLPVEMQRDGAGHWAMSPSAGGLATGLGAAHRARGGYWIGWPGFTSESGCLDGEAEAALASENLIGVPLTVGFISKWYLLQATWHQGMWWAVAVVALGGLLALIYVWRLVELIWFSDPEEGDPAAADIREAPLSMLIPTWLLAGSTIYFGLDAHLTTRIATRAAEILMGGAG